MPWNDYSGYVYRVHSDFVESVRMISAGTGGEQQQSERIPVSFRQGITRLTEGAQNI